MLPHLYAILQSSTRYFWAVSICYKSEQIITFVEVEKSESEKKEWVVDRWGKQVMENGKPKHIIVKVLEYSIKRYQNGMFIVSYPRSVLMAKIKEKAIRIIGTYKSDISADEMNLVIQKELSYVVQE